MEIVQTVNCSSHFSNKKVTKFTQHQADSLGDAMDVIGNFQEYTCLILLRQSNHVFLEWNKSSLNNRQEWIHKQLNNPNLI